MKTAEELKKGIPPALLRLGFELARRGFTYVRDRYIPEGLMEGEHKLQGEKTQSGELQEKRFRRLEEELKEKALERFKILQSLWRRESSWISQSLSLG